MKYFKFKKNETIEQYKDRHDRVGDIILMSVLFCYSISAICQILMIVIDIHNQVIQK